MKGIPLGFVLILLNVFSNVCYRIEYTVNNFMKDFETWVYSYCAGQGCHREVSQYIIGMGQKSKKMTANNAQFIVSVTLEEIAVRSQFWYWIGNSILNLWLQLS